MSRALLAAAAQAGIRITLLDTCYLSGGLEPGGASIPLAGPQLRFGDRDGEAWAARVASLGADEHGRLSPLGTGRRGDPLGPRRAARPDAPGDRLGAPRWARRCTCTCPSRLAENEACVAAYRRHARRACSTTPARSGPRTSVVHATHLTGPTSTCSAAAETFACLCPTTEADLADGIGPFGALAAAGCPLTVGSDSQAVIDLFEETRRIELYERLASRAARPLHRRGARPGRRPGTGTPASAGPTPGRSRRASLADLVTVSLDSPRLAGAPRPAPWRRSSSPLPPTSAPSWSAATTWCVTGGTGWWRTSPPRWPRRSGP